MKPSLMSELDKLFSHIKTCFSRFQLLMEIISINDVWTLTFSQQNLALSHSLMIIGCHSLGIFLTIATSTYLPVLFGSPLQQKEFTSLHYIPFSRRIQITSTLSIPVQDPQNSTKQKSLQQ